MTNSYPHYLYHYCSINTLELILKNRTLRFNNLSNVDDIDESTWSNKKYGKYCFVSCWTDLDEESIAMWHMYASMHGVRLKLKAHPFVIYEGNALVSKEKTTPNRCTIFGANNDNILHKVNYKQIEEQDSIRDQVIADVYWYHYTNNMNIVGKTKNSYWKFQSEWRYIFYILPLDWDIYCNYADDSFLFSSNFLRLEVCEDIPFDEYYLDIREDAINSLEIVLGPSVTTDEYDRVVDIMKKYGGLNDTLIQWSILKDRIK